MHSVEKFRTLASQERFKGWPLVGDYVLGKEIPFFGQTLNYQLRTGKGIEEYVSIVRSFGWVVVFGVTTDDRAVTLVQWKPGVNCASWELPPGGIGKVDPATTQDQILEKTRECYMKETGYGAGSWDYLGHTMIETGKYRGASADDHGLQAHMYMATGLQKMAGARQPAASEIMETLLVPLGEFGGVFASGLFKETSALLCALLALRRLGK